ncbi:serine/threonine-protein kinase [Krasilnikovia cinnamomea]|uniref:non-specific serine/threonine protein kinase n=1 Tax=Krasilnikovia cinnamomea TaxID=349313 RepID=A0A4Q7ZG87_9ACTN|nr:serine/threonine-protein kinase [Krasilnikovia cinnamomea]RZU49173.1 serine/threonine-protein kinase [Krasilnikovia cinnamomea]
MTQDPASGAAPADADDPFTLDLSGRCVGGSYQLLEPIGQGATGQVWRGVDRATGAPVAVKVLYEGLLHQPRLVSRFVQERTILLMLRHRNVVRVRDLVSVGETLALVMDLVPGGSLRDHLREHRTVAPGEAARLTAQIAGALAEAHELGVVHRDLKPDNILLEVEDGRLRTRLTDFGIARMLATPSLTMPHSVVGTPHYMAPESFQKVPASPAADVYALGVLLYELLTGQPPYEGDSVPELMRRHLAGQPVRRPGIPDPLWEVIRRCLRPEAGSRPTAAALAAELEAQATAGFTAPVPPGFSSPTQTLAKAGFGLAGSAGTGPESPPGPAVPTLVGPAVRPSRSRRPDPAGDRRWARPLVAVMLVAGGAMVAAGAATTASRLGRVDDAIGGTVLAGPDAVLPARSRSVSPVPGRSAAGHPAGAATPARSAPVRPARRQIEAAVTRTVPAPPPTASVPGPAVTGPSSRPATRSPEVKQYGPPRCGQEVRPAGAGPIVVQACFALGADVRVRADLTGPAGGRAGMAVFLLDAGTGRPAGNVKECRRVRDADPGIRRTCGPTALNPPRGHRYQVVVRWQYRSRGTGEVSGRSVSDVFAW